jgi:zinc protease
VFVDPALAEQVTVSRHGPWIDHTDTVAFRQKNVRRQLAYGIINRRLQRIARLDNAPFRGAALGTSEVFETARTTNLVVLAGDGEWQRALAAAQAEYRRALEFGFTEAEVAEQVANLRTALENNAAGAETRSNSNFITGAITLLDEGQVPTTPASALQRFLDHLPRSRPRA